MIRLQKLCSKIQPQTQTKTSVIIIRGQTDLSENRTGIKFHTLLFLSSFQENKSHHFHLHPFVTIEGFGYT